MGNQQMVSTKTVSPQGAGLTNPGQGTQSSVEELVTKMNTGQGTQSSVEELVTKMMKELGVQKTGNKDADLKTLLGKLGVPDEQLDSVFQTVKSELQQGKTETLQALSNKLNQASGGRRTRLPEGE